MINNRMDFDRLIEPGKSYYYPVCIEGQFSAFETMLSMFRRMGIVRFNNNADILLFADLPERVQLNGEYHEVTR